jgi:hypothetical protein
MASALVEEQKVEMKALLARHSAENVEIQEVKVEAEAFRARQGKELKIDMEAVRARQAKSDAEVWARHDDAKALDATVIKIQMEELVEEQNVEMKAMIEKQEKQRVVEVDMAELEALLVKEQKVEMEALLKAILDDEQKVEVEALLARHSAQNVEQEELRAFCCVPQSPPSRKRQRTS